MNEYTAPRFIDLPIDQVIVAGRHRKHYSRIPELADSIARMGVLQRIADYRLVFGGRRLTAYGYLGWTTIPVCIVYTLTDAYQMLQAEAAENTCREKLLISETVSLAEALLPLEEKCARKRKAHQDAAAPGNLPHAGRAKDIVASEVGLSRRTLTKAMEVVKAARQDPAIHSDLVEWMDRTGKVDGAYRELRVRRGEVISHPRSSLTFQYDKRGQLHGPKGLERQHVVALKELLPQLEMELAKAEETD